MAVNASVLGRPSDRGLFLTAAVGFPLLVFIGYFRSYYFGSFFGNTVPNSLVHFHGVVMTTWVLYFAAQIALVRTKNIKLHMTMGIVGIALAALVVVVGLMTAYDSHVVRGVAPPGVPGKAFMFIAVAEMSMFVLFFSGAILFRKRPTVHKPLMLMTAINFMPAALVRLPFVPPEIMMFWGYGVPSVVALGLLVRQTVKHRKFQPVLTVAVLLLIASYPFRFMFAGSETWLNFISRIVS